MGKKENKYAVDSLVFAKVKGYPAWPARVTKVLAKNKFAVNFYGTGQVGNIKAEDLSLYVESKAKLVNDKTLKRPQFSEAIEQIEAALAGQGPLSTESENGAPATVEEPQPVVKAEAKESRTKAEPIATAAAKTPRQKKAAAQNNAQTTTVPAKTPQAKNVKAEAKVKGLDTPEPSPVAEPQQANGKATDSDTTVVAEVASQQAKAEPESPNSNATSRSGRKIKPKKYLLEEVEEIPTGTSLKRKLTTDTAPQLSSSVEESAATVTEPVDKPKPAKVQKVAASRKTKVSAKTAAANVDMFLKEEMTLVQMNGLIKAVLNKEQADTNGCIELLERFKLLNITPLMLLKNPSCVETIKRLRRYIGNTSYWGFTKEEELEFNEKATQIRILADGIYQDLKKLFCVPEGTTFWSGFHDLVMKLDKVTASLSQDDFVHLIEPPESIRDQLLSVDGKRTTTISEG